MIGSPGAGATSGSHFDMDGPRVEYNTNTPAFLACASSEAMAGTITPVHFGWTLQMGSTMSNTNNAVVAGLRTTGTVSGRAGICSVSKGLLAAALLDATGAPDCATAAPLYTVSTRLLVRRTVRISVMLDSPGAGFID